MNRIKYSCILLLTVIGFVGAGMSGLACAEPARTTPGDEVTMEILTNAIAYIKANHPDAAPFMADSSSFTLSSSTGKDIEGYTGVTYSGDGWTVSIGHAVVPNYAWSIKADYDNGKIVWIGTSKDGRITEESYTRSN